MSNVENPRSHTLTWFGIATLIAALIWILLWVFHFQYYVSTEDAYVNGNMINVRAVIPGSPIAIYADETDFVKEGQLLIKLDPTEYKIKYEKALQNLAQIALEVKQIYDNVLVAKSSLEKRKIALSKALYDFENRKSLVDMQAISFEDFIHSQDEVSLAKSALAEALHQEQVALDAKGPTPIEAHPKIETAKKIAFEAYYNLFHTSIYAPSSGYIAKRAVQLGQYLTPTSSTLAIIPLEGMWVDANFKETELTWVRIGQPALITFDLYGSKVPFQGSVLGIGMGTGSVFSLIPPQNATGNWIKIVQRLPVRIALDPKEVKNHPLRLGLSCEIKIDISNTSLPPLAKEPPQKPIGTTKVFEMNLDDAHLEIEKILQTYLHS